MTAMDEERIGPKPVTNRAAGAAAFTKRAHDPFLEYTSMASRRYRDLLDARSSQPLDLRRQDGLRLFSVHASTVDSGDIPAHWPSRGFGLGVSVRASR